MIKAYLFYLYSLTVVAFATLILCIFNYNPFESSAINFIYFYTALFFTLTGAISLIIFYSKLSLNRSEVIFSIFWPSVRQGLLFAAAVTLVFVLRGLRLLDIWIGIPIIIIVFLLELFFQSKKEKNK